MFNVLAIIVLLDVLRTAILDPRNETSGTAAPKNRATRAQRCPVLNASTLLAFGTPTPVRVVLCCAFPFRAGEGGVMDGYSPIRRNPFHTLSPHSRIPFRHDAVCAVFLRKHCLGPLLAMFWVLVNWVLGMSGLGVG